MVRAKYYWARQHRHIHCGIESKESIRGTNQLLNQFTRAGGRERLNYLSFVSTAFACSKNENKSQGKAIGWC